MEKQRVVLRSLRMAQTGGPYVMICGQTGRPRLCADSLDSNGAR